MKTKPSPMEKMPMPPKGKTPTKKMPFPVKGKGKAPAY